MHECTIALTNVLFCSLFFFYTPFADKVTELQRELRETQKENKDYRSDLEAMEAKYTDTIESLEMITLDKEVAEERSENLQQEVNLLKDKMEEINVDLDILRKDAGKTINGK